MKEIMARLFAFISIAFILFAAGCKDDDNPAQSVTSIEERINAQKPISLIHINSGRDLTNEFRKDNGTLTDAYAEKGYFIIISYSTHYYNLSLATEIETGNHSVKLRF